MVIYYLSLLLFFFVSVVAKEENADSNDFAPFFQQNNNSSIRIRGLIQCIGNRLYNFGNFDSESITQVVKKELIVYEIDPNSSVLHTPPRFVKSIRLPKSFPFTALAGDK